MDLKWFGPKEIKKNQKLYLLYHCQLPPVGLDSLTLDGIPPEIKRIADKLPYGQFRRIKYKGSIDLAQFIYQPTGLALTAYQAQQPDPYFGDLHQEPMTTRKILLYAHQKNQRNLQNSTLIQSRQARQQQWEQWWHAYQRQQIEYEQHVHQWQQQTNQIQLGKGVQAKLLPFQMSHVQQLLSTLKVNGVALDASDTGTGKTYVALAVAKELNLIPIVVCPKSVVTSWSRAIDYFEFEFEFETSYVANYERYRLGKTPYLEKNKISRSQHQYRWHFPTKPTDYLLIFDECQRVKSTQTQNFQFFQAARALISQGLKILCLSATACDRLEQAYPIALMLGLTTSPKQFRQQFGEAIPSVILKNLGYIVNPETGFYQFQSEFGPIVKKLQAEDQNLLHLSRRIFPDRGAHMKISLLKDQFPDNFISAQAYNLSTENTRQIQKIYQQMAGQILDLKTQQLLKLHHQIQQLEHLLEPTDSQLTELLQRQQQADKLTQKIHQLKTNWSIEKSNTQNSNTDQHSPTTDQHSPTTVMQIFQQARQQIESLKVATFLELAAEFLAEGKNVVLFVNFLDTLDQLQIGFQKQGWSSDQLSFLQGGQSTTDRTVQIDRFQANQTRIMLATIQSGGVGVSLHDTTGDHPRVALIAPTWSATDLLQALGRIARVGAQSPCLQYVLYAADTIEEKICQTVQSKIHNINTLNNNDLNFSLTS